MKKEKIMRKYEECATRLENRGDAPPTKEYVDALVEGILKIGRGNIIYLSANLFTNYLQRPTPGYYSLRIVKNKPFSHIRGFNYQPSYGSHGLEIWGEKFDEYIDELRQGDYRKAGDRTRSI